MIGKLIDAIFKHLGSVWSFLLFIMATLATALEVKYFILTSVEEILIYFFFTLIVVFFILLIVTKIYGLSNQNPLEGEGK